MSAVRSATYRGVSIREAEEPWKSGALAPRQRPCRAGFSPCGTRGLKAFCKIKTHDAAPKGPLFHSGVRFFAALTLFVSVLNCVVPRAHAQVSFERVLNS